MVHILFLIYSFSDLGPSFLPQNYSSRYLLNCQSNDFRPYAAIIAAFLKNTVAIETTGVSDGMMVI